MTKKKTGKKSKKRASKVGAAGKKVSKAIALLQSAKKEI